MTKQEVGKSEDSRVHLWWLEDNNIILSNVEDIRATFDELPAFQRTGANVAVEIFTARVADATVKIGERNGVSTGLLEDSKHHRNCMSLQIKRVGVLGWSAVVQFSFVFFEIDFGLGWVL